MDLTPALQNALNLVQPWAIATSTPESNRLDVTIQRADLLSAIAVLVQPTRWGYLSAITGLDIPEPENQSLEVLYHFCQGGAVVTLRVRISYQAPSLPTICNLIPYASLYERELIEMLGIDILGTPNTDHLLLPDDWPHGVYPLRKSFTGPSQPAKG